MRTFFPDSLDFPSLPSVRNDRNYEDARVGFSLEDSQYVFAELERKVGITSSLDPYSLDYRTHTLETMFAGTGVPTFAGMFLTGQLSTDNVINLSPGVPSATSLVDVTGADGYLYNFWSPRRWALFQGSGITPHSVPGATFKIVRTQDIRNAQVNNNPADCEANAALHVHSVATVNNEAQNVAFFCSAVTSSTQTGGFGWGNDACGFGGVGRALAGATGCGIGGYFEGRRESTSGSANAFQICCTDMANADATYNPNGACRTSGMWIVANSLTGRTVAVAIQVGNGFEARFDVGIGFTNQGTGGSIRAQSIRDDSQAATSLLINGTHATAAIAIKDGSGFLGVGTLSPGAPIHVLYNNATTNSPWVQIEQAGSGDAFLRFLLTATRAWDIGIDNSDGDALKISPVADSFGSSIAQFTTAGGFGLGGAVTGVLSVAGTYTHQILMQLNPATTSSNTSQLTGLNLSPSFAPAGASLTTLLGSSLIPAVTGSSITISSFYNLFLRNDTSAGFSGTITSSRMIHIADGVKSGGTITNQWGLYVTDLTVGTNNYGIGCNVSSGANKFGLYIFGSAVNYLAGNLGLGSKTAPNFSLHSTGAVAYGVPNAAPTDANLANGEVTAYLDETNNLLKFRVRYSGGTLKTGQVSLA